MPPPSSSPDAPPHGPEPSLGWMLASVPRFLALGLGSGLVRPAPGTWGTLTGWLLWLLAWQYVPFAWAGAGILFSFALGWWLCERVGTELGVPDHGAIVWDEMVAIWLVLWLVPATLLTQAVAVAVFRVFDIIKPPPIGFFDRRFPNGFGVMWDDILAALYSLLLMWAGLRLGWLP